MRILCLFAFALSAVLLEAQTPESFGMNSDFEIPTGLKEGSSAPDFTSKDQNGKSISLSKELKSGKVVLMFYRGNWCPVCNKHLSKFQASLSTITDKGASVIAISPEASEGAQKTIEKNGLTIPVISDMNYEIMDKYGVKFRVTDKYASKIKTFLWTDIAKNNGDEDAYLPVPATYVIGQDGKIIKAWFDQNYKNRPTAEEIAKYL